MVGMTATLVTIRDVAREAWLRNDSVAGGPSLDSR